jgi:NAD+ synthase (glutamine-hydrolysing)
MERILIAQINPTVGDVDGNAAKIISAIEEGRRQSVDLVLFSELVLTGYPPEDFLLLPNFLEYVSRQLDRIIAASKGIAVILGVPRYTPATAEKRLFNSAAVISNGSLLGYQDKILLPTYDVFDERRYFEPGESACLWPIAGKKIGVTICEDIWQHSAQLKYSFYRRDPIAELAVLAPDLVLNLSASPYSLSRFDHRFAVCSKAAITLGCPVILCNQVGGNDSLIFDGHSVYVDAKGQLRDYALGFSEDLKCIDLNQKNVEDKEYSLDPFEELFLALKLGLHDYFSKSGFKKACLGLSGGIDSAVVACIAKEAFGADNVLGVTMPSRFSSEGSVHDAHQLATTLGIAFKEISIEEPYQSYLDLLEPQFENRPFDSTEENVQARVRGMILMALSNKFGYIVLSTGNKSELAVGYSTLYGDMCGGLGIISDLTKGQVYALARWINRNGEIIPQSTIDKPPSAELRHGQLDSDSLPPYDQLDNIVQAYVEEHMPPHQIAALFGYPLALVSDIVQKIHRNEYKRRQSPPGLRVSEKAFSIGRRFPIVQRFI